jgi:hypothetical protein
MPTGKAPTQFLKMIARGHAQVRIGRCVVQQLNLSEKPRRNIRRNLPARDIVNEKILQSAISKAENHSARLSVELLYRATVQ